MVFRYIGIAILFIFCITISSCGTNITNTGTINSKKPGFLSLFFSGSNNISNPKKDSFFNSIGNIINTKNIFYDTDKVQTLDGLFFATLAVPVPVLEENTDSDKTEDSVIKSESNLYSNVKIANKEVKKKTEDLYK